MMSLFCILHDIDGPWEKLNCWDVRLRKGWTGCSPQYVRSQLRYRSVAPVSGPRPAERFGMVFVFTLNPLDSTYSFAQVPQCLLAGDSAAPI